MMKKYLLLLFVAVIGISSCKKSNDDTSSTDAATAVAQAKTDDAAIQAYFKANNITDAVKDASGLYYEVVTPGTGAYPTSTSTVTVNYTGALLDGTVFDTGLSFQTGISSNANIIQGWKVGIPHINLKGRIKLFIPSALGYGTTAQAKIPANSCLIFTIDLIGLN